MYTESTVAKAKTFLSVAASIGASAMLVRSIARELFPDEMEAYFYSNIRSFFRFFSSQLTLVIDEFDGLVSNQIYEAAEVYLGSKVSPSTQRIKVSKPEMEKNFNITIERNEEILDCFNGVKYKWMLVCRQIETTNFYNPRDLNSTLRSEVRSLELSFHKKHKDKVLNSYLPYIVNESKSMKEEKKTLKIFTVDPENIYNMADAWVSVNLDHPATFDTIAMETKMKETILEDLERFVRRKDFYRKVGKAWKRGYLLYGPPGTGKSSLIAAMANYLKFDIYDLELTSLRNNSDLRRLLVVTANRSILVVEDIDCSIKLEDRSASAQEPQPPGPHENQVFSFIFSPPHTECFLNKLRIRVWGFETEPQPSIFNRIICTHLFLHRKSFSNTTLDT